MISILINFMCTLDSLKALLYYCLLINKHVFHVIKIKPSSTFTRLNLRQCFAAPQNPEFPSAGPPTSLRHSGFGSARPHLVSLVAVCCRDSKRSWSDCSCRMFFSSSSLLDGRLLSLMARESLRKTFMARVPLKNTQWRENQTGWQGAD